MAQGFSVRGLSLLYSLSLSLSLSLGSLISPSLLSLSLSLISLSLSVYLSFSLGSTPFRTDFLSRIATGQPTALSLTHWGDPREGGQVAQLRARFKAKEERLLLERDHLQRRLEEKQRRADAAASDRDGRLAADAARLAAADTASIVPAPSHLRDPASAHTCAHYAPKELVHAKSPPLRV